MSAPPITTADAAARLGLTVRAVQKMIEAGRLPAQKVGRDYLIAPASLDSIPKQAAGRPPGKVSTVNKAATNAAKAKNGASVKKKGKK
ncbi:MAG: helix-turn-helix domain-containing protein [Pyrinomonadaceae bacterium]